MTTEPAPADSASTQIAEQAAVAPIPAPPTPIEISASPAAETPAGEPASSAWIATADFALLGLLLVLSFFLASFAATNSDNWLHLATGKAISDGSFTFGVDPFSWATEASGEKPAVYWVHHSWLY